MVSEVSKRPKWSALNVTGIVLVSAISVSPVYAQTQQTNFDIPSQALSMALYQYSFQTKRQLAYDGGIVAGQQSTALIGSHDPLEGLKRLLSGTAIHVRVRPSGVIVLYRLDDQELQPSPPKNPLDPSAEPEPPVVVVTATKRPRNIQRLPMAVSQVKARLMEMSGVDQVEDLQKVTSALSVMQGDSPANSALSLRGIGAPAFSIAVEPSILVQIDDVPANWQARSFVDLSDVLRIEVLRGPQNTLYGKSSSAGTINIITNTPTQEFSATASTAITSDDSLRTSLQLSGPVTDRLLYRLALSSGYYDGNVENVALGKTVNGYRNDAARLKLLWSPSVRLQAQFTGWYNRDHSDCCVYSYAAVPERAVLNPDGGPVYEAQADFLKGITPSGHNRTIGQDTDTFAHILDRGVALKIESVLGTGYRLTSVSSDTAFRMNDQLDFDAGVLPDYAPRQVAAGQVSAADYERILSVVPQFSRYAGQGNVQFGRFRIASKTQEIRLLSPVNVFRYMIGLFLSEQTNSLERARGPVFIPQRWDADYRTKDADIFAQLDWYVTPWTLLSLGGRNQSRTMRYGFHDYLADARYRGTDAENAFTYRLSLQHNQTPDSMVYGSVATGYRGGAYDLASGFDAARAAAGPVRPEHSQAFEIGWRDRINDGEMTLSLTAFHADYTDFQSQAIDYDHSVFFLTNIARVRTQGLEFETSGLIRPHWRGTVNAHYLDAKIIDYGRAPCYPSQTVAAGCVGTPGRQDLSHTPLPNAPRWKFSLTTDYNFYPDARRYLVIGGAYRWQSDTWMSMTRDPYARQKAFGVLNLSAALVDRQGRYTLGAFINNVFDTFYVSARESGGRTTPVSVIQIPARDSARYAGIRLSVRR